MVREMDWYENDYLYKKKKPKNSADKNKVIMRYKSIKRLQKFIVMQKKS